jgi:RHS repeat-associated protein
VYTPGISERRSGVSKWSHQDYLGSTKALTNSSETVTDTRQYDAFGLQTGSTGSSPTPFGFAGGWGYQSDETGLQLLGHRYYDPSTGRFLTRDPAQDGRNWYGYCDNNPIKYVDPNGLQGNSITDYVNRLLGPPSWGSVVKGASNLATSLKPNASETRVLIGGAHIVLEFAGLFDPSPTSDLVHAILYSSLSDNENAALYVAGAMVPFATGGMLHAANSAGRWIIRSWEKSTFDNVSKSIYYHWLKHGKPMGVSIAQYTADANALFRDFKHLGRSMTLRNGSKGTKISVKGRGFGIYTSDGKIVSFGYK